MEFQNGHGMTIDRKSRTIRIVTEAKPRYVWIDAAANFPGLCK
ncbi:hypothetical protein NXX48_24165 [Bacteroides faecis]|nr:hypothetical protein [Bacteroides faecis]MCS2977908.1 hypothetical protein [Bacteroides faecis]